MILDDYQDAVRKLDCATKLEAYPAKVYTNTIKGLGQLSVRLKDADIIVLIRERTVLNRALLEKLPRLKLIAQTGRVGKHIDLAACTERGIAVAEGVGSPVAPAELTWALIMAAARRLPQYIGNLNMAPGSSRGSNPHPCLPTSGWAPSCVAKRWASGAMAALVNWSRVMDAPSACRSWSGAVPNHEPKRLRTVILPPNPARHFLPNRMC